MPGGRTGRRRGETRTRAVILAAARRQFAEAGYRGATLREIARDAGVDPALIHHFFGAKINLFRAALDLAWTMPGADPDADPGPDSRPPSAADLLGRFEDPDLRNRLLVMLKAALTDDDAARLIRGVVERVLLEPAAVESPEAVVGVAVKSAHALGMALLRHVVALPALVEADVERLASRVEGAPRRPRASANRRAGAK